MVAMTKQSLGSLIRERRLRVDMSQQELADRLGMTREWLTRLERDEIRQPNVDLLNRLSRIIPVGILEIVIAVGYDLDANLRTDAELMKRMLNLTDSLDATVREVFNGGEDTPRNRE